MESEPKLLGNAGVSRRQLLARSAVAAGVVWAAPVVRTASAYAATAAGTTRPCTQFFVAGISLNGNWFPAYPYGFVPSLTGTEGLTGTPPTTTTTTTVPLATPGQGGATSGVQTRRRGNGPHKLTRRELAALFASDTGTTDTNGTSVTVPKLIEQWVRENPDVPLLEPSVYPQLTQTGAEGWAILLPEVVGPNAAARQPRFIIGYSWMGSQYAYGYVDPNPANPALKGRRLLFPSPIGREPGVGDTTTTTKSSRRRRSTTTSSSSTTSSTTTTSPVAPTTATTTPGAPSFGPTPDTTTTSTSSTTTTSTTTTTTTLPPTTTSSTTTTSTTTTTTLPPTTTTTKPGFGKGGSKTTTTTAPPTTTTTVPPTTTSSTTTTTVPGGGSTTTTTTTSPGGTTTTTTDPFSLWWIAANSGTGSTSWDGLVPKGSKGGNGATSGAGRKTGFVDTGVGPAGPAGPGALSPTDAKAYSDYFGPLAPTTDPALTGGVEGSPIKGVILIYCQP